MQAAFDEESVAWLCAVVVPIIELKGLEGVVRKEVVGSSQEFRSRSHLTALKKKKKKIKEGEALLRPPEQCAKSHIAVKNKNNMIKFTITKNNFIEAEIIPFRHPVSSNIRRHVHTDLLPILKVSKHVVTLIVFVELPIALVHLYWCGLHHFTRQLLTPTCSHEIKRRCTTSENQFTLTCHQ